MRAFVTVGSTQFDTLIDAVLSPEVLATLRDKGYSSVVVQCGKYGGDMLKVMAGDEGSWRMEMSGVAVGMWRYKPSLKEEFEAADLVISHAGSGTILEVLRVGKPMIAVANPTLLDNHQADLAEKLDSLGYLRSPQGTKPSDLCECISSFDAKTIKPFPQREPNKFRDILDEEMGF